MFGINITDDFTLRESGNNGIQLRIHSEFNAKGLKGRLENLTIGWALERMMVKEWKAASTAFKTEVESAAVKLG